MPDLTRSKRYRARRWERPIPAGAFLLVTLLLLPAAVSAQRPSAADTVSADTVAVDPVEVTVLRTPFTSEQAPLAVSVLGGDELDSARGGVFLDESLRGLPGVQVQNRFNPAVGERVAVRGFGARAQFGIRGIRVVVDGIPATLADGQSSLDHLDLGTLGRVEAIRGPASALFGNAAGGVLSFHTRAPASSPLRAEVEQVFGSHGLRRTQLTASGTISETGYLVSLSRIGWEGYRTIPESGGEHYGASERFALNSQLRHPLAGGRITLTVNAVDLDAENPGSVTEELWDDADRPVLPFPYLAHRTRKELRQAQSGLRWEGPVSGSLEGDFSVFGVRREVVNPIPFDYIDLSRNAGGARARLSWTHEAGRVELRWHAGAELDLQDDERVEFPNQDGEPGPEPHTDQAETVQSAGFFLQSSASLPAGGRVLAGLRYDRHEFRADDRLSRDDREFSATGRRSMDAVSPSVGLSLPLGSSLVLFTSLTSVFETPSTTELKNRPDGAGGFNPELEPQTGRAGELGLRLRAGPLVATELTAFRTDLRNELIPFEVPEVEGQVFFRNAGSSRHTGVEASLSAVSPGGTLRGDLTYSRTNARFREYEVDGEDLGGNRIPGLAPNRARATVRFDPGAWYASVSASFEDRVPLNDQNTAEAPSHVLLDLRAGLHPVQVGGVRLEPWLAVTNVADRRYVASAAVNAFGGRYFEPGPGRSWQTGLRARF